MSTEIFYSNLLDQLRELPRCRHLIALAGAPASGKSTIAERLEADLNKETDRKEAGRRAAILAMDGFHFDDRVLNALGDLKRKGAPHTFDVGGLNHMLKRLRENDEPMVVVPLFDRDLEIARAGASVIEQSVELIIVEGNYLLLQSEPWQRLHAYFDLTIFVDVPEAMLCERLWARWQGFNMTEEQIRAKVEGNDLPNGRTVINHSIEADLVIRAG